MSEGTLASPSYTLHGTQAEPPPEPSRGENSTALLAPTSPQRTVSSGSKITSPDRYIPQRQPRRWRIAFAGRSANQNQTKNKKNKNNNQINNINNNNYENISSVRYFGSTVTTEGEEERDRQKLFKRVLSCEIMGGDIPDAMQEEMQEENRFRPFSSSSSSSFPSSSFCSLNSRSFSEQFSVSQNNEMSNLSANTCASPVAPSRNCSQRNVFTYSSKKRSLKSPLTYAFLPLALSPLSEKTNQMLAGFRHSRRHVRKLSLVPNRVLDAPGICDDFYLNLMDWSSSNVLGIGLRTSVYLWSPDRSAMKTRLCDFAVRGDDSQKNYVSAVSWAARGDRVGVASYSGRIEIWDTEVQQRITVLNHHRQRVGSLAWNGQVLASGSRDRSILLNDIREPPVHSSRQFLSHTQEVCGLKWSPDFAHLASGGNDNKVYVWSYGGSAPDGPLHTISEHSAAVKALAWSPHEDGLLASGGGTRDGCIRLFETLTGQATQWVKTGSQVCNLAWSSHAPEMVSTHGYSENEILLWKYPAMTQMAKMVGHTSRVLFMAAAPDKETIVTGAGDETLCFWKVFADPGPRGLRHSSLDLRTAFR